ncbi:hypothetical protein ACFLV6_00125 [Chloroflexota bacterium]
MIKKGTLIEKRSFIRSFVKLVKVKDSEAVLKYSMPVSPDKAIIDKDGVLPTVLYGGPFRLKARTFSKVFALSI